MSHQEVNAIFLAVDQDRSGAIDAAELQAALSKSGFVMSLAAVAQLIRIYDKNNDNRIDLQEFVGLHKFLSKAQAAFAAYAGSITGQLSEDNLKAAIVELGYNWIEAEPFKALCSAFDPQRDGKFRLPEFIALLSFLKSVTGTFDGFDRNRRGTITLNLNQFLYAASFTR